MLYFYKAILIIKISRLLIRKTKWTILQGFMMCEIAGNENEHNVYFHSDKFLEEIKLMW